MMKKIIILISLLSPFIVHAQRTIEQSIKQVDQQNKPQPECHECNLPATAGTEEKKPETVTTEVSCTAPESENYKEYTGEFTYETLPPEMQKFVNENRLSKKGKVYGYFKFENDIPLPGAGLVAYIFDSKAGDLNDDRFDLGNTYSSKMQVSGTNMKGQTVTVAGSSQLFARRVDETVPVSQLRGNGKKIDIHFTEENQIYVGFDTKQTGNDLSYGVKLGLINLNSTKLSLLGATKHQKIFHHVTESNKLQPQYKYVADDHANTTSPFMELSAGIGRSIVRGGTCELKTFNQASAVVSTDPNLMQVSVDNSFTFDFNSKRAKTTAQLGVVTTGHSEGVQLKPVFVLAYERKDWGISTAIEYPKNNLVNYQRYNYSQRPPTSITAYFLIQDMKKKKK